MLMEVENYPNIFFVAAPYETKQIMNKLLDKAKDLLNTDEWRSFLLKFLNIVAKFKSRELIEKIKEIIRSKFEGDEVEIMLKMLQLP